MSAKWEAVWAMSDTWERLALVAVLVGAVAQTAFVLMFATRPWFRIRVGRAIFLKSLAVCLLYDLSVLNTFFAYSWQEQVSACVLMFVTLTILYQLEAFVLSPRSLTPPEHRPQDPNVEE